MLKNYWGQLSGLRNAAACSLLAALGIGSAVAQQVAIPAFQTVSPVQYSCGGNTPEQAQAMRAEMGKYPLSLSFSGKNGQYVSDWSVVIFDQYTAEKATFIARGPVCLLQLPKGSYTVTSVPHVGEAKTQRVNVLAKPWNLSFVH